MTTIKTEYKGYEIEVDAETEKQALKMVKEHKTKIDRELSEYEQKAKTAYDRADANIGWIARAIARKCHNLAFVKASWMDGILSVYNRHGAATSNNSCPEMTLEAVEGTILVKFREQGWYAIGICEDIVKFQEVPEFLTNTDFFRAIPNTIKKAA